MKVMLPASSSSVISTRVFRWWDYLVFGILTIASLVTMYFVLSHWFSVADWGVRPITCSLITGILFVVLINNQGRWFLLPLMRKPRPMAPKVGWKVAVVTTVVPSAEPIEMLCETVKAMIGMDYPHDTWVLDEENDEQVKALCRQLGAKHFSRKNLPQYQALAGAFRSGSKHGNYNAWLHEVGFEDYDILTTFDPDHVPQKSFLVAVLGYFEDARVGYVQAAQAYYNQDASFIARGAAEETYAHYSSVQMAAYGMGYPVIVGCHNSHRMTALQAGRRVPGPRGRGSSPHISLSHQRLAGSLCPRDFGARTGPGRLEWVPPPATPLGPIGDGRQIAALSFG